MNAFISLYHVLMEMLNEMEISGAKGKERLMILFREEKDSSGVLASSLLLFKVAISSLFNFLKRRLHILLDIAHSFEGPVKVFLKNIRPSLFKLFSFLFTQRNSLYDFIQVLWSKFSSLLLLLETREKVFIRSWTKI